jgi:glycine cleavage system H protein
MAAPTSPKEGVHLYVSPLAMLSLKLLKSPEITMSKYEIRYSHDHLWVRIEGGLRARLGITHFLQAQLKKAVYVELPEIGAKVISGEPFGTIESSKTVSDLISPLSGKVAEVNKILADDPGLINKEPYEGGWLLVLKPDNPAEFDTLLADEEYQALNGNDPGVEPCQT